MSRTITLTVAMPYTASHASQKANSKNPIAKGHNQSEKNARKDAHPLVSIVKTRPKTVVLGINEESHFHFSVFSQWPEKSQELEKAPEISMLTKRPFSRVFGKDTSFLFRFLSCFGTICKNRVHPTYGLADFKPLDARTNHTHEYVNHILKTYAGPPSPTSSLGGGSQYDTVSVGTVYTIATTSSRRSKILNTKEDILKEFYEAAHLTLQYLQNGITLYKQIILTLSFTRYSEKDLTPSEIKLTSGKSIIGSCLWVITYAIQKLQDEPEFKSKPRTKSNPVLSELASEIHAVTTLGFHAWAETVLAIGVLERIHRKTENLFHKQTNDFHLVAPPDSEDAIFASVHLKKYRRCDDGAQLRKFEGPHSAPTLWHRKYGVPRIIYDKDYTKPGGPIWKGFDPLNVKDKVSYLRNLLSFIKLILESVMDSAKKIVLELQGQPGRRRSNRQSDSVSIQPNRLTPSHIQLHPLDITCYEDGLFLMDEILSKYLVQTDWTRKEIEEFFEIDKIFLDDIDCLTLGAGLTRAILHDARHAMHICYETIRLTDFFEFHNLPEYLKVHKKVKDEAAIEFKLDQPPSANSSVRKPAPGGPTMRTRTFIVKKDSIHNPYDIEELSLELKNVANIFRGCPYFEIAKTLPIYCSQIGITLQEAQLVFTPSSERLLSRQMGGRGPLSVM